MKKNNIERRDVLKATTTAIAAAPAIGTVGASSENDDNSQFLDHCTQATKILENTGNHDAYVDYLNAHDIDTNVVNGSHDVPAKKPSEASVQDNYVRKNQFWFNLSISSMCGSDNYWAKFDWKWYECDDNNKDCLPNAEAPIDAVALYSNDYLVRQSGTEFVTNHICYPENGDCGSYGVDGAEGLAVEYNIDEDFWDSPDSNAFGGILAFEMWDDDPDAPDNAKKLNAEYKHTYQTHDFTLSLNPTEGLLFIDDDIQDEEWGGQWETHLGEKEGC